MIAVAVGITDALVDAGCSEGALAHWWRTGRPELNYFSPRSALQQDPGLQSVVLDLARADAAALRTDLERVAAGMRVPAARHIEPIDEGRASTCRIAPES